MAGQPSSASPELEDLPEPVRRYFAADARRDVDALLALFTPDGTVVDEEAAYRGAEMLREWQHGPAPRWEYRQTTLTPREVPGGRLRVIGAPHVNSVAGTPTG